MALVRRWGEDLPAAALERVRHLMTRGAQHRGNTENHWLMHYTAQILALEYWPDVDTWWNGLPPQVAHAEATRWITGTIERTAVLGHHEYDSPQYHLCHVLSMIALADHAADDHLRRQAEQMATLHIADMALEYFKGAWAGGHSREGYRQNTWTRTGSIPGVQYLYFGGEEFDPREHCHDMIGPALTARYRPPALLANLAWERGEPHVVKKTKAPRSIYRHSRQTALPVRKYTYMSRSFALGSTQVGLPGPPAGPIDLVSWDLTWSGARHETTIVCNHPFREAGRFSAFLGLPPQGIGRAIATGKPYLQYPDRLFGASPYERMVQHEGSILLLYRIPEEDETPYVNLYLPDSVVWEAGDAGWLFGDAGDFYIGLRPIGPYRWERIQEPGLIDGWLLRISDRHAGLGLEAAEATEATDFATFRQQRAQTELDLSDWPFPGRVGLVTTGGRKLEIAFPDAPPGEGEESHSLDGVAIDYSAYPLYEAPGVEAPLGPGKMVFRHQEEIAELDFQIDPARSLIPMRVIG
jgi:hypothetical protein